MLVKENNVTTEQTYSVAITVTAPGNFSTRTATLQSENGRNHDYSLGEPGMSFTTVCIQPNEQNVSFTFFLNHDEIYEGLESFQVIATPNNGFPTYGNPSILFTNTLIKILDNDSKLYTIAS